MTLNGTIAPASRNVNLSADARRVDLATWLPMLGYDVPITGRLDAQTRLIGAYPDVAMRLHAAIFGGTAGRMTLERFEVSASAAHGRGTIESAVVDVPSMTTVASGTFGLRDTDPLALVVTSTSPNVGDFLKRATGKDFGVTGALSSTLRVEGTRAAPRLRDSVALQNVRYRNLTIPRVAGEVDADRQAVAVRNGEVDLDRGKALISAAMPIRFAATGVTPGAGRISASLAADDVELSNFAALLPKGSQLAGRIDGRIDAGGSVAAPRLNGTLTLANGTFNGPMERSPITGITGSLAFSETHAQLQSHAFVGSGLVTASAVASLADLRRPADVAFALNGRATNARLDLPAYFSGNLNGTVALVRRPDAIPAVSGDLSVDNARIPLNAFLNQKSGGASESGFAEHRVQRAAGCGGTERPRSKRERRHRRDRGRSPRWDAGGAVAGRSVPLDRRFVELLSQLQHRARRRDFRSVGRLDAGRRCGRHDVRARSCDRDKPPRDRRRDEYESCARVGSGVQQAANSGAAGGGAAVRGSARRTVDRRRELFGRVGGAHALRWGNSTPSSREICSSRCPHRAAGRPVPRCRLRATFKPASASTRRRGWASLLARSFRRPSAIRERKASRWNTIRIPPRGCG